MRSSRRHCTRGIVRHSYPHAVSISLLLLLPIGCGGGASTSDQISHPSSTIASVSAACTPSTVPANGRSQCVATVTGAGNYSSAVTWSATGGALNASGLFTGPPSAGTITVTATSTQDPTKSGTAAITVQPSSSTITSVQVACNPSTVSTNTTSQCTATVKGSGNYSSAVTWTASDGTINSSGVFTAPAAAASVTITATSVQDTSQSGTANLTVQSQTVQTRHIVMVMEENTSYANVVRNSAWPNLNQLIANGALATNYYADSHPSIGNYFMLTTGKLLTTNDSSTKVWNVDNIARHMLAAQVPFRIYAEGITQGYVGGDTGTYLIRHNPFAMLSDVAGNPQVANQTIWPFTQFAIDLANGTLPEFSFIVPDVNDDAHNGTPQQADLWLQTNVVIPLSNSAAFAPGGDGLLIVDFDEAASSDATHGGGQVACVFWGPVAKTGYTQASGTLYQHQSTLRTVMDELGLSKPPGAAAGSPSMSEFLQR
jgi:phosphatidylinositol-3-phosphatase